MDNDTQLYMWGLQRLLAQRAYEYAGNEAVASKPLTYTSTRISEELTSDFSEIWLETPRIEYSYDAYDQRYTRPSSDNSSETWNLWVPHLALTDPMKNLVTRLCEELRHFVQSNLGYFVSFVNVRVYDCLQGMDDNYFGWHSDSFPDSIKKVMIYLTPLGEPFGTTLVKIGEEIRAFEGPAGTAYLFDNNLTHKAVGPTGNDPRRAIELTIAPSVYPDPLIQAAGTAANWPVLPFDIYDYSQQLQKMGFDINVVSKQKNSGGQALKQFYLQRERDSNIVPDNLNIGGGPNFYQPEWINLDGAFGMANYYPFKFNDKCYFPIQSEKINKVYTCHTFEHFDEKTLSRVLEETHRVMAPDAEFLIKIPDYDLYFSLYENGDTKSLEQGTLIHKVSKYIQNADIELTCETVLSFALCNYWNSAYGTDLYEKASITDSQGAYFGPAKIREKDMLKEMFKSRSPYKISQALRAFVITTEDDFSWGHQIAFSFVELRAFLEERGFVVISNDKRAVMEHCKTWPEIEWLADRSMFVLLKKLKVAHHDKQY